MFAGNPDIPACSSFDCQTFDAALAAAKAAGTKLKNETSAELSKHGRELKDFAIDKLLEVVAALAK